MPNKSGVSAAILKTSSKDLLDPAPRLRERGDRSAGNAKNKCGFRRVLDNIDQEAARLAIPHPPRAANTRDIRLWAIDRLTPSVSARR